MLGISEIVHTFEEIEQRLVQSLKRNLSRHQQEEQDEGFNWSAWQAEKLRSLDRFRRENAQIMGQYTDLIDSSTRQIMQEEFAQGVNGSDTVGADTIRPNVAINGADGRIISAPTTEFQREPDFFGIDDTKVNKLIEDITYLEKNAETAALRLTDDVYRQTVNRVQLAMSTGSMTLQQAVDIAVKDFLDQGINCIVYKDGRRVNIADYIRMALRTTAARAALQGKSAKYKALGYDTVQVSSYGMCSKTCEPWQGRIYIEDTFSFWDGEVMEQGGILWGKSNYCGKWFPLLSSAIEKGLFHPNCRHSISLWRDGDPLPESVDNSDSERRYKLEQKQRGLEREIRRAKRRVNGLSDPDNIRKAKAELRQAQKNLKDFIDKVNAEEGETVLKRDYGREKVYEGEVKPEYKTEPPVSDAPVPEGKAVEVTVSEPEKAEGAYTEVKVPKPDEKSQSYRPVQLNESDEAKTQRNYEVKAYKTENTQNGVYVSENVNIKPKKLHQIDRHISEALDKMEITDRSNLPNILVVSREDMATTDVAVYRAIENQLLICEDMAVYKPQDMPEVMGQLTCGKNDLSSYIHELYHWIDAEEYRRKFGAVTAENYDDYIKFINNKAKDRLDKLAGKGYNILVSDYAKDSAISQFFYEVYTEFRTFSLLGGD